MIKAKVALLTEKSCTSSIFRKMNMVDNMVQKLEKYANNLETIVAERTKELVAKKEKTDQLLHKMLPKSVCYTLIEYTKTYMYVL